VATWGDVVRVIADQDQRGALGLLGSVSGIRETDDGRLLLVEFGDGEAHELWEHHAVKEEEPIVGSG